MCWSFLFCLLVEFCEEFSLRDLNGATQPDWPSAPTVEFSIASQGRSFSCGGSHYDFIQQRRTSSSRSQRKAFGGRESEEEWKWVRDPDHRIETPGYPEVETGIYIADAKSKNAGAVYYDIRRIDDKGKRLKTLRLDKDFYGSILAHAIIAEKLSLDETISASERERFATLASDIADAVLKCVLPEKAETQQANGKAASPFSKAA